MFNKMWPVLCLKECLVLRYSAIIFFNGKSSVSPSTTSTDTAEMLISFNYFLCNENIQLWTTHGLWLDRITHNRVEKVREKTSILSEVEWIETQPRLKPLVLARLQLLVPPAQSSWGNSAAVVLSEGQIDYGITREALLLSCSLGLLATTAAGTAERKRLKTLPRPSDVYCPVYITYIHMKIRYPVLVWLIE